MSFQILPEQLEAFVNDPAGGIARELERVAEEVVKQDAYETLSLPYDGPFPRGEGLNPPPGPPRLRTGDLRASLEVIPAVVASNLSGEVGLAVYVAAYALHPSQNTGGLDYTVWLRERGYRFLPETYYL